MKPIFVITQPMETPPEARAGIREYLPDYHVLFALGETKCQLFSVKETIELTDLKQVQDYLDAEK